MKHLKWIAIGYFLAFMIQGCDSVMGSSEGSTTLDLEYGDYGTFPHKPLYVRIVE